MINNYIDELEKMAESDYFDMDSEEVFEKMENDNIGNEVIDALLVFMENHSKCNFGMPGAIVHYLESFAGQGYEEALMISVKRNPIPHTIWMVNRCINDPNDIRHNDYISLFNEILEGDYDDIAKENVKSYI